MSLSERKAALIKQIYEINDEHTLEILQENLVSYKTAEDPLSDLSKEQLADLTQLIDEPDNTDAISLEEFMKGLDKWRTK